MQEIFDTILGFVSRPDKVVKQLFEQYGNWVYLVLFLQIFAETGLIFLIFITAFLPGDALLFALGMIAANEENGLKIEILIPLLMIGALLGDNLNYLIGRRFGHWILQKEDSRFYKKKYLKRATRVFKKRGRAAIIIARFTPVIRTLIPFVCGIFHLKYKIFLLYSFIGATVWVAGITLIGYFLGQFKFVENNLGFFIIGIIVLANLPTITKVIRNRIDRVKRFKKIMEERSR